MVLNKLTTELPKVFKNNIYNYQISSFRNLLLGASLAYAVEKESYAPIPLIVIFPTPYAGYHIYKNKDNIVNWISNKIGYHDSKQALWSRASLDTELLLSLSKNSNK